MHNTPKTDDYLNEIEGYLKGLPRPDERTFYMLLIEMANTRAQLRMLTGLVLDLYSDAKGRDFSQAAERITTGLSDRQAAMREQTIDDLREILERLHDTQHDTQSGPSDDPTSERGTE